MTDEQVERVARALIVAKFGQESVVMFEPVPEGFRRSVQARKMFDKRIGEARIEARAAIAAMQDWRLIESAPRDGTDIDLWVTHTTPNRGSHSYRVADCCWGIHEDSDKSGEGWCMPEDDRGIRPVEHSNKYFCYKAAHWRPLSDPPDE